MVINELDWYESYGNIWNAPTGFGGMYVISYYAGMLIPYKLESRGWFSYAQGMYETLDEAKQHAQIDFNNQIMHLITPDALNLILNMSDAEFNRDRSDENPNVGISSSSNH